MRGEGRGGEGKRYKLAGFKKSMQWLTVFKDRRSSRHCTEEETIYSLQVRREDILWYDNDDINFNVLVTI